MNCENNEKSVKDIKRKGNLEFSVAFNENGESFQNIMERILLNKITKSH